MNRRNLMLGAGATAIAAVIPAAAIAAQPQELRFSTFTGKGIADAEISCIIRHGPGDYTIHFAEGWHGVALQGV